MAHPPRLKTAQYMAPVGAPIFALRVIQHSDRGLHDHEFVEVVLIESGRGRHCTLHGEDDLAPGTVLILHPGQWHYYHDCRHLTLINIGFAPSLLAHELAWVLSDPLIGALLPAMPASGAHPVQEIRRLVPPVGDFASARAAAERLLVLEVPKNPLQRRVEAIGLLAHILGAVAQGRSWADSAATPQPLTEVLAAIERDLTRAWALEELATMARLTASHFCRRFRVLTGHPPLAWIHRRRAENAAVLLLTTDEGSSTIGERVGWKDPNYFARRFRAVFGQSPSAYRQRMRRSAHVQPATGD